MNEEEQLLWVAVYTAATTARFEDPGMKADNAVLRYRQSLRYFCDDDGPDDSGPELWPDEDVPF